MKKLKDLRISTKMIIIVVMTFVIILFMALFSIIQLMTITNEISTLKKTGLPLMEILNKITFNSLKITTHFENSIKYFRQKKHDKKMDDRFYKEKEQYFIHIDEIYNEIKTGEKLIESIYLDIRDPVMKDMIVKLDYELRNIEKKHIEYQFLVERIYNLILQNKTKEAEKAIQKTKEIQTNDINNIIAFETIVLDIENFVNVSALQTSKTINSAIIGILIFASLIFLLNLGVSIYITRTIRPPLLLATDIAKKIARGERNIPIPDSGNDEIGMLLKALRYSSIELFISEKNLKKTQDVLIDTSHKAGMAEIAIGVLHNIGNILNSVNISIEKIVEITKKSEISSMLEVNELLMENHDNITDYIENDEKGKLLPQYYYKAGESLYNDQQKILNETNLLLDNVNKIKETIDTQQYYAKGGGLIENLSLNSILNDTLKIQENSFIIRNIIIKKEYLEKDFNISIQKSKLINILLNLFKNAYIAMEKNKIDNRKLIIFTYKDQEENICISIKDNGEGIKKENINNIFNYGFTTKKDGHGFGLHSCANFMSEMNGKILVKSDGLGKGTEFILIFSQKAMED